MFGKGPNLAKFGISGVLSNPQIELHNSTASIGFNDQWQDIDGTSTGLEDKLTEANFAPGDPNESALWPTLRQGNYTTILSGVNNGTGIGLVEFYEY
jgi:hypothetical protein